MTTVLLVEDDRTLLRALAMNLAARGYRVIETATGTAALTAAGELGPDLVVLDLGLPDLSGLDVIRGIRAVSTVPIIVLSARTGSHDKVAALDRGADDYVTKPFSIDELLARLRVAERRLGPTDQLERTITLGRISVDLVAKTVVDADAGRVRLTPTEWHLLETLLRNPGRLLSGPTLLSALRGSPEHTDPSYLRIYMSALRRKIEAEPSRPRFLITEPGMGYRYEP